MASRKESGVKFGPENGRLVFSDATGEQKDDITLIAAGDITLAKGVEEKIKQETPSYPFEKVSEFLSTGDIVFGNFDDPPVTKLLLFPCCPAQNYIISHTQYKTFRFNKSSSSISLHDFSEQMAQTSEHMRVPDS